MSDNYAHWRPLNCPAGARAVNTPRRMKSTMGNRQHIQVFPFHHASGLALVLAGDALIWLPGQETQSPCAGGLLRFPLASHPAVWNNPAVQTGFSPTNPERFAAALRRFDEANAADPNVEEFNGQPHPRELLYAQWLTDWVLKLAPHASEALRLAARCQHICRWEIPRDSYPLDKPGYLRWRANLKKFHAEKSGQILREVGYDESVVQRVQELNRKQNHPQDPEVCVLEDALCLVFLERQLAPLAARSADEKMINALKKSWQKMTPAAQAEALKLNYGDREKSLIARALAP